MSQEKRQKNNNKKQNATHRTIIKLAHRETYGRCKCTRCKRFSELRHKYKEAKANV